MFELHLKQMCEFIGAGKNASFTLLDKYLTYCFFTSKRCVTYETVWYV